MKAEKLGFHGVCVCAHTRARVHTHTLVHTHSEDSRQCWVPFSLTVQLFFFLTMELLGYSCLCIPSAGIVDSNQHCNFF